MTTAPLDLEALLSDVQTAALMLDDRPLGAPGRLSDERQERITAGDVYVRAIIELVAEVRRLRAR